MENPIFETIYHRIPDSPYHRFPDSPYHRPESSITTTPPGDHVRAHAPGGVGGAGGERGDILKNVLWFLATVDLVLRIQQK